MRNLILKVVSLIYIFNILFIRSIYAVDVEAPEIVSPHAGVYLMDDDLELLYGKEEDAVISIASITKVMTSIVAIENIDNLNEKVTVDFDSINAILEDDYAIAEIEQTDELTYYDLLATMLIPSGADSALALGMSVFGDMNVFVDKMNEKATQIGMTNSHFANVIGIDDEQNYSTINDVAKMFKYALQNPVLKEIMTMKSYTTSDGKLTVDSSIASISQRKNVELKYTLGGKTGTTGDAGICLASYAVDEGNTLLCITAGADMYSVVPYNLTDTETLYDYIANKYSYKNIVNKNDIIAQIDTLYGVKDKIEIKAKKDISVYTDNVDKESIKLVYNGETQVTPYMQLGEKLGEVEVYYNDEKIDNVDIILEEKVEFSFEKWFSKNYILVLAFVIFIIIILVVIKNLYQKRQYVFVNTKKLSKAKK